MEPSLHWGLWGVVFLTHTFSITVNIPADTESQFPLLCRNFPAPRQLRKKIAPSLSLSHHHHQHKMSFWVVLGEDEPRLFKHEGV